ncbi:MAG: S4 domain-containing protein YaaA [Erysipelotrichaceae bacterium]|nr:S4 domain-containing protein YaaA [Erysipelotrichaceae bacterium]
MGNIEKIEIRDEYITLGQLLKICDFVSTGGAVKWFLSNETVLLNGESENRRGKKLYKGDHIVIGNREIEIC